MQQQIIRTAPPAGHEVKHVPAREWLVTNGLGGYASGPVTGMPTRRYHGLLVAALPEPLGRLVMLTALDERLHLPDGRVTALLCDERLGETDAPELTCPAGFRLEEGLPVWQYHVDDFVLERRLWMLHGQNTTYVTYRLLSGTGPVRLSARPALNIRPLEAPVGEVPPAGFAFSDNDGGYEVTMVDGLPPLRLLPHGRDWSFTGEIRIEQGLQYGMEAARGYTSTGDLWTPGCFQTDLIPGEQRALSISTEPWQAVRALTPAEALSAEQQRRRALLAAAPPGCDGPRAELVLAADQFVITPVTRIGDLARARAAGDEPRSVIAGYHWFTDWGRDTMISLEGLALVTGRHAEAGDILRTFGRHVRDGLIPNLFPEGESEGLYHTADASLWFFHAVDRYLGATGDRATLQALLPALREIADRHLDGTRFGIGVDPADGLLRQGAAGYQLTWMDAKVGDWVVTPRRGKAVEINALWYNALCLLSGWVHDEGGVAAAGAYAEQAERARRSFNECFWYDEGGYLYDVIDGDQGDDPACRPNQVFAISLRYPVLAEERWVQVLEVVRERLLTPVGLRSLAPGHPDYCPRYDGDLRARDAAYHQGTVWGWLIGPFIDAWLRVYPERVAQARSFLNGLIAHLGTAGIGSISEIFDAEPPYTPRGCIAQAWSVAEVLRCWLRTRPAPHSAKGE